MDHVTWCQAVVGIRDHVLLSSLLACMCWLSSTSLFKSVWHVKKNIEFFISRQEIKGLGLRGRNNLNTPRCRLLKTEENFPLQALKLVNRLPQDVTALSLKIFESWVGWWLGIKLFYSLEEFNGHNLSGVWVFHHHSFFPSFLFFYLFFIDFA